MEENRENSNSPSWRDVQKMYTDAFIEIRENANRKETIASEMIADLQKECSKKDNAIRHVITTSLLTVLATILMMNINREKSEERWRQTMERMNNGWIEYLSQYDFVTQDGEGINYYNSDVIGDVNNGATGKAEKE